MQIEIEYVWKDPLCSSGNWVQWFLSSILASHNAFKDADDGIAVFLCNNDDEEEDAENDGED